MRHHWIGLTRFLFKQVKLYLKSLYIWSFLVSNSISNFFKLDCLLKQKWGINDWPHNHRLAGFFDFLYKADQGLPQSSSWCGTSPRVILVRIQYLSGSNTCPVTILVRARYLSGLGTCLGVVDVWARHLSWHSTCPGAVLFRAWYLSGRSFRPGAVLVRAQYLSESGKHPHNLRRLIQKKIEFFTMNYSL